MNGPLDLDRLEAQSRILVTMDCVVCAAEEIPECIAAIPQLLRIARAAQAVMAEGSSVDESAIRHEGTGSCRFCHAPWEQPVPYPHPHQPTCVWGTLRAALAGR